MEGSFAVTQCRSWVNCHTIKFSLLGFTVIFGGINELLAENAVSLDANSPQITILEGKTFSGDLGLVGKPASATDLLVFNDGMFVSKGCENRCGYTAAKYQIKEEGDYYRVNSETPCLKSDAVIQWRGTVKGNQIEGTFTWVNKRWYWTFEKEFWFKGELIDPDVTESGQQ